MKARKFDTVELNQTVTFEENGMIETGVVCNVEHNKFTLRALRMWDNCGVITYYDKMFSFFNWETFCFFLSMTVRTIFNFFNLFNYLVNLD